MKKTFKKQLILLAVVTVMMILALVMPASAEEETQIPCPGMNGGGHLAYYLKDIVIEPTCTQRGYSKQICTYCNDQVVVEAYKFTEPTGHNYVAAYVDKGDRYERVRTCQNPLCQRGGNDITDQNKPKDEIVNGKDVASDDNGVIKYYRVEYVNKWARPDGKDEANKGAFLDYCYTPSNSQSWVSLYDPTASDAYAKENAYVDKVYTTGKKATLDHTAAAPAYEYVEETAGLTLYVQESADVPAYPTDKPVRNKDLVYGRYNFDGWSEPEIEGNKRVYEAEFTPDENATVSFSFRNYNGAELTASLSVPYGGKVNYGDLVAPVRENDQYNEYKFEGWTFGKSDDAPLATKDLKGDIYAYYNTAVYADFSEKSRQYTVEFMVYDRVISDEKAYIANTANGIECKTSVRDYIAAIDTDCFTIDRDKKYIYKQNADKWIIKKVNGESLLTDVIVSPDNFDLPKSVYVKDSETGVTKEVFFGKNETNTVTIAPTYTSAYVRYNFKVTILPTHFLDEDVYPDNGLFKSDILDKFVIQVTDENGQFITAGTPDKNGDFWFEVPYRDEYLITASLPNGKYYGEHELDLAACVTAGDVERIAQNGIFISPRVTQEWTDGLKSCNCVCHSFLSGIVVRIYNLLYRLFNIKYVCCDDLFIVHGKVLIYTK